MKTNSLKPSLIATTVLATALSLSLATQSHAQRPLGIDVYAGNGGVGWAMAYGGGVRFAYAKATEGNYYQDANFSANMAHGKTAGVLMGGYHFARPDINGPGTEANYFWNFAGGNFGSGGDSLMPMLDMEVFSGHQSASSYTDWANTWSSDVVSKAANVSRLQLHTMVYVSACNACEFNSNIAVGSGSWIASYNGENLYTGTPWSTCTGCEVWGSGAWNLWQQSENGSVPGVSGSVDIDTYNGTLADMKNKLVVTAAP